MAANVPVVALIGDVVSSRRIADRPAFQARLQRTVDRLNRRRQLLSPFTITLGDEFQAVYADPLLLLRDVWYVAAALQPHRIRFAIGLGRLTTPVNPAAAIGMDGPAFHRPRDGISALKSTPYTMTAVGEGPRAAALEDHTLRLLSLWAAAWWPTRWRVLGMLARGRPPAAIAAKLGISATAVYKNIEAGALHLMLGLGDEIGRSLADKLRTT